MSAEAEHHHCAFAHLRNCLLGDQLRVAEAYRSLRLLLIHCDPDGCIQLAQGPDDGDMPDWSSLIQGSVLELVASEERESIGRRLERGEGGHLRFRCDERYWPGVFDGSLVAVHDDFGAVYSFLLLGRLGQPDDGIRHIGGRHLERVLESMPQFVGWADRQGRFGYLNRSGRELAGLTEQAALPPFASLFPHLSALPEEGQFVGETTLRRADDGEIPVALTAIPERDGDGQLRGATIISRDIRERLRQEEERGDQFLQMAQAQRMASLGVLVASVAHEINNPNNFVMFNAPIIRRIWQEMACEAEAHGFTEATTVGRRDWAWTKETVPRLLDGIEHGAERIKTMVAQLRSYTRSPAGRQRSSCDCHEAVNAAVDLVAHLVRKHTRHMVVSIPDGLPPIHMPGQALEQVMLNLVVNACQALEDPGQAVAVTARAEESGAYVRLSVQDEGRGIPPEILERLGGGYVTTKTEGTGLGLAIVRRLLDQIGGEMNIVSNPGLGTTVTLILPTEADHER